MYHKLHSRLGKPSWLALSGLIGITLLSAQASAFSNTSVGYRYGTEFAEPFRGDEITKNIFNITHASSFKYGTNFINADFLFSNGDDEPADPNSDAGAREAYVVARSTFAASKLTGESYKWGLIRDFGFTLGVDWNNKDDAGYNSKKIMWVAGPTIMLDVPGFLNISLLQLWESNAPCNNFSGTCVSRYHYDPHPMLNAAWSIPIAGTKLSFEGFANFITSKGKNEFGRDTKAETNIDAKLMYDASSLFGTSDRTFKVGLGYQYWRNKFGNDHKGVAGSGAFAKTPMFRMEYRF